MASLQNLLYFSLSSASLKILKMSIPTMSLILSTNLILGLPRFHFPKTIPMIRSYPSPLFLITWPTNESFRLSISCSRHGFCPSLPTTHSFICMHLFPFDVKKQTISPKLKSPDSSTVTVFHYPTLSSICCYWKCKALENSHFGVE